MFRAALIGPLFHRFHRGGLGLVLAAALSACAPPEPEPLYTFEGSTMGTYYRVKIAGKEIPEEQLDLARDAVREELAEIDGLMSTYLPHSEVSRLNRHLDGTPFAVSAATFEVLRLALELGERTGGAFDVTVGPLVEAWGFGPGVETPAEVDAEAIARTLERVGFDKLELDEARGTVRKARSDLECDLSAIAKGYGVDRVAERLGALGIRDYWVEVGGEVRAAGEKASGVAWRLGIERPRLAPGAVQRIVPLRDMAVATSGDYRNYREIDGIRFSHIIDPRSGWPIRHRLASASVFHPRCAIADALATALMVLGEKEGYELAIRENLPAYFIVREDDGFSELGTPAFWDLAGRPPPPEGQDSG